MNTIAPITVIVCCYNSAARLPASLESLAGQEAKGVPWELVLVDNASTDHTAKIARKLWTDLKAPVPLKIVSEDEPGLSHARLRGVQEARYETVGFVDDDNWLDPAWVCLAAQTMAENPRIGLLGSGNIEAVFERPVPEWVSNFAPLLACATMAGSELQIIRPGGTVAGAGMVTRKQVFRDMREHYGSFQTTGRKGASTSSGEDIEFAYIAAILGWRIAKHPNLRMKHFIPAGRTQPDYLKRLLVSMGQAANLLDPLRRFAATTGTPSSALLAYARLTAASVFYGCGEVWRAIGWGRKSVDYERIVADGRRAQLTHLLKCFTEYHGGFSKAKRFAISQRCGHRANSLQAV